MQKQKQNKNKSAKLQYQCPLMIHSDLELNTRLTLFPLHTYGPGPTIPVFNNHTFS